MILFSKKHYFSFSRQLQQKSRIYNICNYFKYIYVKCIKQQQQQLLYTHRGERVNNTNYYNYSDDRRPKRKRVDVRTNKLHTKKNHHQKIV